MGREGVFERLCFADDGGVILLIRLALRERGLYGEVGEVGWEGEVTRLGDVGGGDGRS